jgi:two-component system, NarL family, invasion response regulator UvrY
MRILIADDHAVLRKGLIQLLAAELENAQFGEASTTEETLDGLSRHSWDALILDLFMPGRGGLAVLDDVRRQHPKLPVLVLSTASEEQMAARVLKAGARGYLNKQVAAEKLVKAVKKVLAGGRYVSAAMAERLAENIGLADRPLYDGLSGRDYTVLQLLVAGKAI